jgi:hypothetical protein
MTQWLPIETYPYDGTWGLFRGGELDFNSHRISDAYRASVVTGEMHQSSGYAVCYGHAVRVTHSPDTGTLWYRDPTEWLPLSILDMLEDHHITAARIML